jgi:hypothetical protein
MHTVRCRKALTTFDADLIAAEVIETAEVTGFDVSGVVEALAAHRRLTASRIDPDQKMTSEQRSRALYRREQEGLTGVVRALRAIPGPVAEEAARNRLNSMVSTMGKFTLDPGADAATAARQGLGDEWAQAEAFDAEMRGWWDLLDKLRESALAEPTLVQGPRRLNVPIVHRYARPWLTGLYRPLYESYRNGAEPGVYTADEARAHIAAYETHMAEFAPPRRGGFVPARLRPNTDLHNRV